MSAEVSAAVSCALTLPLGPQHVQYLLQWITVKFECTGFAHRYLTNTN